MNYKQKQRIKQLTESTLITGADIAKSDMWHEPRTLGVLSWVRIGVR